MTAEDVQRIILARMRAVYLPPTHLRTDREAQGLALRTYERALSRFSPGTLEQAWERVCAAHEFWIWPQAATFAAACAAIEPQRPSREPGPDERKRQQAQEMADDFTSQYRKKAHLARAARKEGWLPELMEYVHASAWVQAQLLCGVRNIAWDARLLTSHLGRFGSLDEAFAAFRATLGEDSGKGGIRVEVSRKLIREWKQQAVPERQPAREAEGEKAAGSNGVDGASAAGTAKPARSRR